MKKTVFVSYRRAESRVAAQRTKSYLERLLPECCVFVDVSSIAPGASFPEVLKTEASNCDVLLAYIGPNWAFEAGSSTKRRILEDENDFVRIELELGLERPNRVIPVLLDGAVMPTIDSLPATLSKLSYKNALHGNQEQIENTLDQIIRSRSIGVYPASEIVSALEPFSSICHCAPNISNSRRERVLRRSDFYPYEDLVAIVDLTFFGTAEHFLAFSTAGIYHRNTGMDRAVFLPYCRLTPLDASFDGGHRITLGGVILDVSGTFEKPAFDAVVRVLQTITE